MDILLVEDNPGDVELTLDALRWVNPAIRIEVSRDGEEALDFLFCRNAFSGRQFDLAPRLVLLDLKLPKVNGLEVLRQIKAHPMTKAIPVVILTTSRQEQDLLHSYLNGVNAYLQKPVDFEEFRQMMKHLAQFWLTVNQSPPPAAFKS